MEITPFGTVTRLTLKDPMRPRSATHLFDESEALIVTHFFLLSSIFSVCRRHHHEENSITVFHGVK